MTLPTPTGSLRAGELARLCGVSTDTLRHYERVGVLAAPRRTSAGYRLYPREAELRVRVVRRAIALGFTLRELSRIFRVREKGGAPCREVRALAAAKLSQVDEQLADLGALRDHLARLLDEWDHKLDRTPHGVRASLLDGLGEALSTGRTK